MLSLNYENINYVMSQILKLSCVSFRYVSISYVLAIIASVSYGYDDTLQCSALFDDHCAMTTVTCLVFECKSVFICLGLNLLHVLFYMTLTIKKEHTLILSTIYLKQFSFKVQLICKS